MIALAGLIVVPLVGAFGAFLFPRAARGIALLATTLNVLVVLAVIGALRKTGVMHMTIGGWKAPLGIELYADGLTGIMLALAAIITWVVTIYAVGYFQHKSENPDALSRTQAWWPLVLLLLTALNALFLTEDLFNLYVTLELLSLAAVGLVALDKAAITGAIRYLLVSIAGSLLYLLGIALLYGLYGSVSLSVLAGGVQANPIALVSMAFISGGLILKTALFPLHAWLPPAHANAFAPVSALLSALVVKASFYALFRLWSGTFEPLFMPQAGQVIGILGAGAVIWGSLQAVVAPRLKLLIAYSTVAQIGYLFLFFPFIGVGETGTVAWYGALWLVLSHGLAKASLFLAAGNIITARGHDRFDAVKGIGTHFPLTLLAIGLACVSLMGLPPSAGFIGKWLLLNAALASDQWWWALILVAGGVLAGVYSFKILDLGFSAPTEPATSVGHPSRLMEWSALMLALGAIIMGLWTAPALELMALGSPVGAPVLMETPQ